MSWQVELNPKLKKQKYLDSHEWAVIKRVVWDRSNGVCERCFKYPLSDVHHLTYDRLYAEHLDDLQGLCRRCHKFVHGRTEDDPLKDVKWISPRRQKTFAEKYHFTRDPEKIDGPIQIGFADDGIDAFVLRAAGLNCGVVKNRKLLFPRWFMRNGNKVVLYFCDLKKVIKIGKQLQEEGFEELGVEVSYIRPPQSSWDKMFELHGGNARLLSAYIEKNLKKLTRTESLILALRSAGINFS